MKYINSLLEVIPHQLSECLMIPRTPWAHWNNQYQKDFSLTHHLPQSNDSDHHEVHTNGKHREEEQQEAEASQARSGSRRAPAYQQEPDSEEDDDDKSFATAPEGSSSHGHVSLFTPPPHESIPVDWFRGEWL